MAGLSGISYDSVSKGLQRGYRLMREVSMAQGIEKLLTLFLAFTLPASVACAQAKTEKAVFAGGCFWCMTPPFEKLNGVVQVLSGYTGGNGKDPTYADYAQKGHI